MKKLECALESPEGEPIPWEAFDNPDEPRTIFQFIVRDRKMRVDQKTLMADRPPIAIIHAVDNRVVRLEFYEGHDELTCSFDLRSKELQGKDLPLWMGADPCAYDPAKFLKEAFSYPEELTRPWLKALHEKLDKPEE